MYRNELGRYEMHPLPNPGKGKLFILGEYPNMNELKDNTYFISNGAEALRQTLNECGIDEADCCFSMAIPYLVSKKSKEVPVERYRQEQQRVLQEIRDSEAKVVMPLGVYATCFLLNTKSLTMKKILGNIFEIPELPGVKIICNYHPALLLHQHDKYKTFQKIMQSVAILTSGGKLDPGKTEYVMTRGTVKLKELIALVNTLPYVAADIETSSLDTKAAKVWVIGVCVGKNLVYVIDSETYYSNRDLMVQLLNARCKWIWHHGKYDTKLLAWQDILARIDEDTIYLHYALNETSGTHNLGQLATVYLGADEYKSKMNSEFSNITTEKDYYKWKEDLCERVAIDADYTFQIFEILSAEVKRKPGLETLYRNILLPAASFLREVEMNGVKVDVNYLESRVPYYEQQIEEMTATIQDSVTGFWDPELYKDQSKAKTASEKFKPTSVKQLQWMIYDRLKLKPTARGAMKKRGTGAEVLESIEKAPDFILQILQLRSLKKEYSTYVKSYLKCKDEQDIIHPTFNLHVTATGRLSCTEPNIQNVPSGKPDIRRALIPRKPGNILMEVDYSGAELRVLAFLSGDEKLTKALVEGDMHSEVAEMLFGPDFTKLQRGIAKTVNFGIIYGRGAKDLSATFEVSLEEAQSWIDGWAKTYPEAWAYLEECERYVEEGKTLTTIYNRERRLGLIHKGNFKDLSNEAKNFRVQSVSSDNTLLSAMKACKILREEYGVLIVNLIHDSILLDCPGDADTVAKVSNFMATTMINMPIEQYNCTVPFRADVDIGFNWGDFYAYDRSTGNVECKIEGKKEELDYEEWYNKFKPNYSIH